MQQRIIWFAIVASTLIYAALVFTIAREPQRSFDESLRLPVVLTLYVVALVTLGMSFVVPPRIRAAQPRFIARLALTEAVAIYGLVAAMLAHDWRLYLGPWVLALIGFMQAWPASNADS